MGRKKHPISEEDVVRYFIETAREALETGSWLPTLRSTAKVFGISKSSIHNRLTSESISEKDRKIIRLIFDYNLYLRAYHGGSQRKYRKSET